MGRPKLLLPFGTTTVIESLLAEIGRAQIQTVVIVLRKEDLALSSVVSNLDVTVIAPEVDPPDMKTSVSIGLEWLSPRCDPAGGWLLIPADHPLVSAATISALQAKWEPGRSQILIPTFDGKRGHPTVFSWDLAREIPRIPADRGLNWLVREFPHRIREVPVPDPGVTIDLDTPEDYARYAATAFNSGS